MNYYSDKTSLLTLLYQFVKFGIVGFVGLIIDFGITFLLKEKLRVNKYLANAIGFSLAASFNYVMNRIWTFHSENNHILTEYSKFLLVSLIGLLINSFVLWLLLKKFKLNFYFCKLIAIAVTTLWNFFVNLIFTFNV